MGTAGKYRKGVRFSLKGVLQPALGKGEIRKGPGRQQLMKTQQEHFTQLSPLRPLASVLTVTNCSGESSLLCNGGKKRVDPGFSAVGGGGGGWSPPPPPPFLVEPQYFWPPQVYMFCASYSSNPTAMDSSIKDKGGSNFFKLMPTASRTASLKKDKMAGPKHSSSGSKEAGQEGSSDYLQH